jgi:hypothetical protein
VGKSKIIVFAHENIDLDGAVAFIKLMLFGESKIPGITKAEIRFWKGDIFFIGKEILQLIEKGAKVVFVDIRPSNVESIPKKGIYVFDHHPHGKYLGKTSCSIVDEYLGLNDPVNRELTRWSIRADFKGDGDPMNIGNIVKNLHLLYSDEEVLKWIWQIIEVVYQQKEIGISDERGKEFFLKCIDEFLTRYKGPVKLLERWKERVKEGKIKDKMNIINRIEEVLKKTGKDVAKKLLTMAFEAMAEDQRLFQLAEEEFRKGKAKIIISTYPITVVGYDIKNSRFNRYARFKIHNERGEIPIVAQFSEKGFQIFGNKEISLRKFDKIVAHIREAVLTNRGVKKYFSKEVLGKEGMVEGAEPLYYHRGLYPVVLWGALTSEEVEPLDINPLEIEMILVSTLQRNKEEWDSLLKNKFTCSSFLFFRNSFCQRFKEFFSVKICVLSFFLSFFLSL